MSYADQANIVVNSGLEARPVKFGPWGGNGGMEFDTTNTPARLDKMTIRAGELIDSIGFSYVDEAGEKHTAGPFGGTGGQLTTIEFAPTEWVKKLSFSTFNYFNIDGKDVVASLELETNIKKYGPYGKVHEDYKFNLPMPDGVTITGFFGRAGMLIDALGVYWGPLQQRAYADTTDRRRNLI